MISLAFIFLLTSVRCTSAEDVEPDFEKTSDPADPYLNRRATMAFSSARKGHPEPGRYRSHDGRPSPQVRT